MGWYEEGVVALVRGIDLVLCAPRAVVLATGGHELVPPFVNGDLPGVMTGGAVRRLLVVHGVRPWRVATVLANDARGYALAAQLAAAGVAVACVADQRPAGRVPDAERRVAADLGIRTVAGVRGVSAHGLNAVRAVTLQVQPDGGASRRSVRLACDLICVCLGARPADELARQAVQRRPLRAFERGPVGSQERGRVGAACRRSRRARWRGALRRGRCCRRVVGGGGHRRRLRRRPGRRARRAGRGPGASGLLTPSAVFRATSSRSSPLYNGEVPVARSGEKRPWCGFPSTEIR